MQLPLAIDAISECFYSAIALHTCKNILDAGKVLRLRVR